METGRKTRKDEIIVSMSVENEFTRDGSGIVWQWDGLVESYDRSFEEILILLVYTYNLTK